MHLKTYSLIFLVFLGIIVTSVVRSTLLYRAEKEVAGRMYAVKEASAALSNFAAQLLDNNTKLTDYASAALFDVRDGDGRKVPTLRAAHERTEEHFTNIVSVQVPIELHYANRSVEEWAAAIGRSRRVYDAMVAAAALGTQMFDAIEQNDADEAYRLFLSKEHSRSRTELVAASREWLAAEEMLVTAEHEAVADLVRRMTATNILLSILGLALLIAAMFLARALALARCELLLPVNQEPPGKAA